MYIDTHICKDVEIPAWQLPVEHSCLCFCETTTTSFASITISIDFEVLLLRASRQATWQLAVDRFATPHSPALQISHRLAMHSPFTLCFLQTPIQMASLTLHRHPQISNSITTVSTSLPFLARLPRYLIVDNSGR